MLFRVSSKNEVSCNLIGECFVLDLMHGEMILNHQKGEASPSVISEE